MSDLRISVPASASHPKTNDLVFSLIAGSLGAGTTVLDFGAGRGHMAARVARRLAETGADPRASLIACDLDAAAFEVPGIDCAEVAWVDTLPWPDATFDLAYSIEVIEHLENPYAFVREMLRVLKPGGRLVITTPNIHHMTSRFSNLLRGYPTMFGVITFTPGDEGHWLGHVTPIVWTTLYACLDRAGGGAITLHVDRRKKSSIALAVMTLPAVRLATVLYRRSLANGDPEQRAAEAAFGEAVQQMASFDLLTSRSLVVEAVKSGAGAGAGAGA